MRPGPSGPPSPRGRRRSLGPAALVVGLALVLGTVEHVGDTAAPQPPRGALPAVALRAEQRAAPSTHVAVRAARVAPPRRVVIPAIGLSAPVGRVGLNRDHTMQVPTDFSHTGWYTGSPRPGERGPAVIVGHVDSRSGPAVFFRLGQLHRGDHIQVVREGGSTVRFTVEGLERAPKDAFPTRRVYGPTRRPTLRLVTCGGSFDQATGHYRDNTIVYAAQR
jgi:hypothetical protein